MNSDIRSTPEFKEAELLYSKLRLPGTGQISNCTEIVVSPLGGEAMFSGTVIERLDGIVTTRICRVDLSSGRTSVLTFGPNTDRLPKYSPCGCHVAFLSDRGRRGDFQLYLLDPVTGSARQAPRVDGWIEYLHWSPSGRRILLGVAGHGADVAGGQGAITSTVQKQELPAWSPSVKGDEESHLWRRCWLFDVAIGAVRQIGPIDINVWEANWCGEDRIAAVVSPGPSEGLWYTARLIVLEVDSAVATEVFTPQDQVGWPSASPSGKRLAFVEAACSDRWVVAGTLRLMEMDARSPSSSRVDTKGIDITFTEWRSERHLLLAGHRGLETVVGLYDAENGTLNETWSSRELTLGVRFAEVSGFGEEGDCLVRVHGFFHAPEIGVIRQGVCRTVKSFLNEGAESAESPGRAESVSWTASDGLEIQGWLLCPHGKPPYPLVMNVHGGPVWLTRSAWLGGAIVGVPTRMLLRRGYAVFFPNPRGSSGRGQEFARSVRGDMGGADAEDLLSGLDFLVRKGLADPERLGVTGGSYGGFMTSWLVTQDSRFAAAVAVSPHTNHVTEHLIGNIPHCMTLFVGDSYSNSKGSYFARSPVMHAHNVKTPTLSICGALDRCTPPEEAIQFHHALLENGAKSALVVYPQEGHGVQKLPAAIDYAARLVGWFDEHMAATATAARLRTRGADS